MGKRMFRRQAVRRCEEGVAREERVPSGSWVQMQPTSRRKKELMLEYRLDEQGLAVKHLSLCCLDFLPVWGFLQGLPVEVSTHVAAVVSSSVLSV